MKYTIYRKLISSPSVIAACIGGFDTVQEAYDFMVENYSVDDEDERFEYYVLPE